MRLSVARVEFARVRSFTLTSLQRGVTFGSFPLIDAQWQQNNLSIGADTRFNYTMQIIK